MWIFVILKILMYIAFVALVLLYLFILLLAFMIGYLMNMALRKENGIEFFIDAIVVGNVCYEYWTEKHYKIKRTRKMAVQNK